MLDKHSVFFSGLVAKLKLAPGTDLHQGFHKVSEELFSQDVSWSKIVSLFAFGASLASHYKDKNIKYMVYNTASSLAEFSILKLTPFLKHQGGWVSCLVLISWIKKLCSKSLNILAYKSNYIIVNKDFDFCLEYVLQLEL